MRFIRRIATRWHLCHNGALMRIGILICGFMLVPAFAVILEWRFERQQRPRIEEMARIMYDQAGLNSVSLELDHFRPLLKGICLEPAGRDQAEALLQRLPMPLKVDAASNQIRMPARVSAQFEGAHLHLTGWLDGVTSRDELADLAGQFRPELTVHADAIALTPYAVLGPPTTIDGLQTHAAFAGFLESIRPTTMLSITPEDGFLRVRGCLPSERLRQAVLEALKASSWEWPMEASKLVANPHAPATLFTQSGGLAAFLRSYYDTPAPGTFTIDARNGPRLKAVATPAMESRWRTLLLPLSGAVRVQPEFTIVPSDAHMPGYKPTSFILPEIMVSLQPLLGLLHVHFERGSIEVSAEEQAKLGPLAFALRMAGFEARFIVAGYEEPGSEPGGAGGRLRSARAHAVVQSLVSLGVPRDVLLPEGFDAPRPPGVITEELRRESRRVELLVK